MTRQVGGGGGGGGVIGVQIVRAKKCFLIEIQVQVFPRAQDFWIFSVSAPPPPPSLVVHVICTPPPDARARFLHN